ncbi:hypothetical protein N7537_011192 [Penicillium hordei]|uniref:Xaa-Pro dipeptidyl-peptidase C-terminal domain-containing protein n=1 Tax=Penicillium hordei TaxID=40994 RepID=A0AAD6DL97_9EURO|nr:uncharacterized protein N7537_011192 [Penicillium hordei]KAJ5588514.1 hypothetical protein N7537_011192 [Penicillium hordei]
MSAQSHASFVEECMENRKEAEQYLNFCKALSPDNPKARFTGFHQRITVFKNGQQVKPGARHLPVDIAMHESVPMILSDGVKLYCDIFLPASLPRDLKQQLDETDRVPALVAWSPYGKQMGTTLLDDFPFRAGVPKEWLSGLEKWEGPDPAFWCAEGYAVINVDTRGAFTSEGKLLIFGHQEAQDGAEFVTWVSEQTWCNSKVALTGNSWLAMAQWKIGSLRPKGLAALAPWEGLQDQYRDTLCQGGIPSSNFHDSIVEPFASYSELEDLSTTLKKTGGLWNPYWEDKRSNPDQINVPTYVVSSWTNPVHTPGTFRAFGMIPDSTPKWLRVHNSQEWPDYYADSSTRDLKRFFDHYLKGHIENGWLATPKIRLSILNLGLSGLDDTVNRPELEWPLARTRYEKLYLSSNGEMCSFTQQQEPSMANYNSASGKVTFRYVISEGMETTGYFVARLVVSCPSHSDMDLFVQVCCLDEKTFYRRGVMTIRPNNLVVLRLLKLLHDWHFGLSKVGMLFHWGPAGQMRVSHSTQKSRTSVPFEPIYEHTKEIPLVKGEKRVVEIPLRPYGMYWKKGTIMELTVSGNPVIPFPIPGVKPLFAPAEVIIVLAYLLHHFKMGLRLKGGYLSAEGPIQVALVVNVPVPSNVVAEQNHAIAAITEICLVTLRSPLNHPRITPVNPKMGSHPSIVSGNDPLTQHEFPWIPQDFAFPFGSPLEIYPTNTSDVMFDSDRTALSFGPSTSFYLDEPVASTPRQMNSGTIITPESVSDEPMRQRDPATPMRFQSYQAELPFPSFPQFSPDDTDLLVSDSYCHVPELSELDYGALLRFYHESVPASDSENKGNFPRREVLNAFVQLYFEFFHPGFHLLHQATFQRQQRSSCLFLAVAAIGAQYSRVTSRGQCSLALLETLRRALLNNIKLDCPPQHDLQLVQATILYIEYLHWTFFDLAPLISVSELHACLPCDDELWQSSDLTKTGNLMQADTLPPHSPSVLDLLGPKNSGNKFTSSLGSSASLFTMISACAKERSLFQLLKPTPMDGSANEPDYAADDMCAAHSCQTTMIAEQAISNIAGKLHKYQLAPYEASSPFWTFSAMRKIYSISRILNHIPYKLLYVSSGWMASKEDTRASLADLEKRLRHDPQRSRRTLTYAAQVFRRVRNQKWLEACDPLYVLLSTLYIWFYGRTFEISADPESEMWPPLKIDDESLDETVWVQWVDTGDRRPHIAGIGYLNGENNVHRVLKEAIRILSSGQGWQHFAHSVANSLERILSGLAPSFKDI